MSTYLAGTEVVLSAFFTDGADAPVTPTNVVCKVKIPNGRIIDLSKSVVKSETGSYDVNYIPTVVGTHVYEFVATGNVNVVSKAEFDVTSGIF